MLFHNIKNIRLNRENVLKLRLNELTIYARDEIEINVDLETIIDRFLKKYRDDYSKLNTDEILDYINHIYADKFKLFVFPEDLRYDKYDRHIVDVNYIFSKIDLKDNSSYKGLYANEPEIPSYIPFKLNNIDKGMKVSIDYIFYTEKFYRPERFLLYEYNPETRMYDEMKKIYPKPNILTKQTANFIITRKDPYVAISLHDHLESSKFLVTNFRTGTSLLDLRKNS